MACECHAGFDAASIAVHSKTAPKTATRALQNQARRTPKPFNIKLESAHVNPDATKRAPRASNKHQRDGQECPRSAQKRKLAPSWRPETLQDRSQDAKKMMLKNNAFFASISQWFKHRFGRFFDVFWRNDETKIANACFLRKP